jgi:acetyl esterase/lipase
MPSSGANDRFFNHRAALVAAGALGVAGAAYAASRSRKVQAGVRGLSMAARGFTYLYQGEVVRDLAYGDHPRQRLDVFPQPEGSVVPCVVFAHGGGFTSYNKDIHAQVGRALQNFGFVGVTINYRLFPEVTYPTFVEDTAAAIRWTQADVAQYGGDPDRIVLSGHSAGAIMTALLALDGDRYGLSDGALEGAVCISGMYDYGYLKGWQHWVDLMGGLDNYGGPAQPIALIDRMRDAPPLLLIHGEDDQLIPVDNARMFQQALTEQHAPAELIVYPEMDHYDPMFSLTDPESELASRAAAFISQVSGASDLN